MAKQRLDTLLTERGLFTSRTRAAASVMAGEVLVGAGRRRASKPGEMVDADDELVVQGGPRFASRGGEKLANALMQSGVQVRDRNAIDVGASTGGFTDCLLQAGANHVIAVDVGYGLLDYRLRSDERVSVLERFNARELNLGALEGLPAPDLAVVDVSFISLTKVLGPLLACLPPVFDVLAMVKPQFEVGREGVGKGGVVRSPELRRGALVGVGEAALLSGCAVVGYYSSGLPGPKGNRETFIHLVEGSRPGGTRAPNELEALARTVEDE